MIKLIISDIDGTLVPDGTDKINHEIFSVIQTLYKRGIRFAAASGRQFISIKKLFEPIADIIFYIPDGGSVVRTLDETIFEETIPQDIAKEVARDVLPVGLYTRMYVTYNIRNLMHFLDLRGSDQALYEIREVSDKMEAIFKERMPLTYKAWKENR